MYLNTCSVFLFVMVVRPSLKRKDNGGVPQLLAQLLDLGRYNLFDTNFLFLNPLKTSENVWFSDFFQGCKKEALTWNEYKCVLHVIYFFFFLRFSTLTTLIIAITSSIITLYNGCNNKCKTNSRMLNICWVDYTLMKTTFHLAEIFNVVYFNVYLNIMSERPTRNLRIYSHLKKCQTENLLFCNGSFHGQQEPRICNL